MPMKDLDLDNIRQEAKEIKQRQLNLDLVYILMGERKGTKSERQIINNLLKEKKETIYSEAVYLLTHIKINNPDEAKQIIDDIILHRNEMVKCLKRNLSIQVATLDYMQNIKNLLKKPTIIEMDKAYALADKTLYQSKKNGKKKIQVFHDNTISEADEKKYSNKEVEPVKDNIQTVIKGKTLIPGFALGTVFHYKNIFDHETLKRIEESQVNEELSRIRTAIEKVKLDLINLKKNVESEIDKDTAQIFDVHKQILNDIDLLEQIDKELGENLITAEQTIKNVFNRYKNKFKNSESKYLNDKVFDLEDIESRLLRKLTGIESNILSTIKEGSIIFTHKLNPSDIIHMKQKNVKAIITKEGGYTSHSSIIARSLGIPLITDVKYDIENIPCGQDIIVDGDNEQVIINPDNNQKEKILKLIQANQNKNDILLEKIKQLDSVNKQKNFIVSANISTDEDFNNAIKYKCDSIGLLRIEPFYMHLDKLPTEDELYDVLAKRLGVFKDKEITIRIADFGGDKTLPYLDLSSDFYSKLGLRGIRFLLANPELLKVQVRVLLRLSFKYNIRILIPMVTVFHDIISFKNSLSFEMKKLDKKKIQYNKNIPIGAMIEVPAALIAFDAILSITDFICIGTNDLIQYITASDREILSVADYFEHGKNIILKPISDVIKKAKILKKDCTLCGELAGNIEYTDKFLKMGLTDFSVNPIQIPHLKNKIYSFQK